MDSPRAKTQLRKLVTEIREIRMITSQREGKGPYVAEGNWNLVGEDRGWPSLQREEGGPVLSDGCGGRS